MAKGRKGLCENDDRAARLLGLADRRAVHRNPPGPPTRLPPKQAIAWKRDGELAER